MARLISVNVGQPRDISWRGETVHTGIGKQPVMGSVAVRRLNLDGDGQGDLAGHGGTYRAVMVYQLDSYRYWERYLGRNDFCYGQFSENFTVEGLPDSEVCIGDRYRVGTAVFEVTQPRVTCYRLSIKMDQPDMPSLVVSQRRPGFYFRVLDEGAVTAGDEITLISKGPEPVTVAGIDGLLYLPGHQREQLQQALRIPALSPGWKGSLEAMLAQESSTGATGNAGLNASAGPPPAWLGFRPLRVAAVEKESDTVLSFFLQSTDGSSLPPALPGQFLVLKLHSKAGTPPVLRNYSLSGEPGATCYRVSVKREMNGVASAYLHQHVGSGDLLEVSAPRGGFTLRSGTRPVVLVSAGVGATPVLTMLYELTRRGASLTPPREVWWVYGTQNRNSHPFADEVTGLLQGLANAHSYITYSEPGADDRLGVDYDAAGRLSAAVLAQLAAPQEADFYLCGPPAFMEDISAGLKKWGVPATRIYSENFGSQGSLKPGIARATAGPVHPPSGAAGPGPQVAFTRSGLTVPWNPRFQTLLELAEACDVPVRWSCRVGVCHTCESGLIGGTVSYQPDPLEPPAQGDLLICCSRPVSDVELDL